MEVIRTNFQEVLKELDDVLEKAEFLGIDGEFTGLNSGPEAGIFDTPAQYYSKLRSGSMDFLLVQFGLSVFSFDKDTNKYTQRSYSFYAFPRPLNRMTPDCRFMCQASSISFLAHQGFDFNKLFKLGIPYLTSNEEEKLLKRIEEKKKLRDEGHDFIPISDDDKPHLEEICGRISEFITSDAEELIIDKCNAFMRRLVYQEAKMRWQSKLRIETKSETRYLVVQKVGTKEEEEQKEIERREKEKLEVQQAVGLSTLLRKIADSGKLIVGHNMLLDLCHIVHQFFAPLPESYREFKSLVHGLFPRVLDTKVLCESQQLRETVPFSNLNVILDRVSKPPFSIPEVESVEGRSYSTLEEKTHEAGYDAYITGLCFIAMSNYLGSLQKPEISTVLGDSPLLKPFLNKLLIARLKDFPYINIVGKDPNPSREHVFHVTFPKEWKHSDLSQLFNPFGTVYVSWLSDTSAYVGLHRRDQASTVIKTLNTANSVYKIQKYQEHQASLESSTEAHSDRKRKLSSTEAASASKDEKKCPATNGVKPGHEDDQGWQVATGNEKQFSSESTSPFSYPNNDSRAIGKRRESPKYTTLRREPDSKHAKDNDDPIDDSRCAQVEPVTGCKLDKKECQSRRNVQCDKSKTSPVTSRSTKAEGQKRSSSPRKLSKTTPGLSPSASPKLKKSPKKQSKIKADAAAHESGSEVKLKEDVREGKQDGLRKRSNLAAEEEPAKVQLKKPTLKLLKSAKKRSENVFITGRLIVKMAQVAGVLLLIYVIVLTL